MFSKIPNFYIIKFGKIEMNAKNQFHGWSGKIHHNQFPTYPDLISLMKIRQINEFLLQNLINPQCHFFIKIFQPHFRVAVQ
jgi:hypothetical protein